MLSSPDVLLGRMSAHRAAVLARLGASTVASTSAVSGTRAVKGLSATYSGMGAVSVTMGAWPPLLLVDPAATGIAPLLHVLLLRRDARTERLWDQARWDKLRLSELL